MPIDANVQAAIDALTTAAAAEEAMDEAALADAMATISGVTASLVAMTTERDALAAERAGALAALVATRDAIVTLLGDLNARITAMGG